MAAQVGWRLHGHPPKGKGKHGYFYDKEAKSKPLTPPFASKVAADEFAEDLRKQGYIVTGVRWHGPSQK